MTAYLKNGPFSVQMGGDKKYRDNFDAIDWGKKPIKFDAIEIDGTKYVTENYEEGQNAPSSATIDTKGLTVVDEDPNFKFTENDEQHFSELVREYDIVPLKEIEGSIQHDVREFHRVMGQPICTSPGVPSDDRVRHRLRLIHEEYLELVTACGVGVPLSFFEGILYHINNSPLKVDLVEVADALADIAYVVEGANLEFGIDSEAVLAEVQRSNMSKLDDNGKAIVNDLGKVTKGPNYSPPDIKKVLSL